MNNKKIITKITDEQIDDLLTYTAPYTEQSAANIKARTLEKIKPKKMQRPHYKRILIVAAMMLFLSIGVSAYYYISTLFFVPGVGITDDVDIKYYGLEKPITIQMDSGTVTIEFVTKVTRNGKTELSLYIDSYDNFCTSADSNKAIFGISANGEAIVSDERLNARHGISTVSLNSNDEERVSYYYCNGNFPDVNEFDLTFCGTETRVSLVEQAGNSMISQESNGITFAAYKFNGVKSLLAIDIHDKYASNDYLILPIFIPHLYDENDDEILLSGGGNEGNEYKMLLRTHKRDHNREVKKIKIDRIELQYASVYLDNNRIEIPVPKDGETIKTDIAIQISSHTFRITEVRREGDIIYYENNAYMVKNPEGGYSYMKESVFDYDSPEYKKAVEDCESFISATWFRPDIEGNNTAEMGGGEIWDFNPEAEILVFNLTSADILQYGDFDITFD